VILDYSSWVHVLAKLRYRTRSKANTKFIERIGKHPDRWLKERAKLSLSLREVQLVYLETIFDWLALSQLLIKFNHLSIPLYQTGHCRKVWLALLALEVFPSHPGLGVHYPHCATASCYFGKGFVISLRSLLFTMPLQMSAFEVPLSFKMESLVPLLSCNSHFILVFSKALARSIFASAVLRDRYLRNRRLSPGL
jgi:hypothetical protein